MAIKVNNQSIQKIMLGNIPVKRIYEDMQIVFDTGVVPQPCFEVVSTISEASGDYVDVYVKSEQKWYKRNNLNQYEEYGLMPVVDSLSSVTYYTGKMVILNSDTHEYKWSGSTWVDLGDAGSLTEYIFMDPPTSNTYRVSFPIKYYFGEGYKMRIFMYVTGTYGGDTGGFMQIQNKSPIEFNLYSNGFYFDAHNPTSTTSPSVYSGDYSTRVMAQGAFNNYKNTKMIVDIEFNKVVITDFDTGTQIYTGGSLATVTGWYDGLYEPVYSQTYNNPAHVAYIQIYDNNGNLVNDLRPKYNADPASVKDTITWYDSVIQAEYYNDNSYSANYHKETVGELDPPEDYDTKVPPADNVHYNTLAELEMMECPWIGMVATIGANYDTYVYTENGWVPAEVPLDLPYLRFTPTANTTFTFTGSGLVYSIDGGAWRTLEANTPTDTVGSGSYVLFRGEITPNGSNGIGTFSSSNNVTFAASGNIMSLLYGNNFVGQTSMKAAHAFQGMFNSAKVNDIMNLVLPSTTVLDYGYKNMFSYTSITSAPRLIATTVGHAGYDEMFANNFSMTSAPEIDAETISNYSFQHMFANNNNMTSAPSVLKPLTLPGYSCYEMFMGTKITRAPEIDAVTLTGEYNCYCMFKNCSSMTIPPVVLKPETLTNSAYRGMFQGCTNIEESPFINARTLASYSIQSMFYTATKLKKVAAMFTTTPSTAVSNGWLNGVAATGIFTKNPNATWDQSISRNANTVPSGWTINDYQQTYLTFTVTDDNGSRFKIAFGRFDYSVDGGEWATTNSDGWTPVVSKNSVVRIRYKYNPSGDSGIGQFFSMGKFNMSGNPMSLLYGDWYVNQEAKFKNQTFRSLFAGTEVVDAQNLVICINSAMSSGFRSMFQGCSNLVTAPSRLQVQNAGYYGMQDMFASCTSLVTAPEIDCIDCDTGSFSSMFSGCTSLVNPPSEINVQSIKWSSCYMMFYGCSSLTSSPIIRGNMSQSSCNWMFYGCSSMSEVTYLGSTSPSSLNSDAWMYGVPATGTIYKNQSATWDQTVTRDENGVPSGWTIDDYLE